MKERFFIEVKDIPDHKNVKIIEFKGEIDITNSHYIIHKIFSLVNNGNVHLVGDFSQLVHINSSGIFNLLRCYSKLREASGWMRFINLTEPIREVFISLGITRVFSVYESVEDALKEE